MRPNGGAERRTRRRMSLALYLPRVRSSDLLGVNDANARTMRLISHRKTMLLAWVT
jgi:hypothetical protein